MNKKIKSLFILFAVLCTSVSSAFTPTSDDMQQVAVVALTEIAMYALHKHEIAVMDETIDFCKTKNARVFSRSAYTYIQKQVQDCGVVEKVIPITGLIMEDSEDMSWGVLLGKNSIFYLNIPRPWVYFLNDVVNKIVYNKPLTEAETTKLHTLRFIIHHEMAHITKNVSSSSYASRNYPIKTNATVLAGFLGLGMYLNTKCSMSYTKQLPLTLALIYAYMRYVSGKMCKEEYECDSEYNTNIDDLRAGKEWLLSDCKNYVDDLFSKKTEILQVLYQKYPDHMCSLFTQHPHPVARAARLEEKIVALQAVSST